MRVLFAVFPANAHLYPVVPLAWALQLEGHEVRVATHPSMTDSVGRTGLSIVPFGFGENESLQEVLDLNANLHKLEQLDSSLAIKGEPDEPWHDAWLSMLGTLAAHSSHTDELVALCQEWQPDLVVWDPIVIQAAVAARACGAAHVRLLWGQDNVAWLWDRFSGRSTSGSSPLIDHSLDWLMDPMLAKYGMTFEKDMLLGQLTIDPRPAEWRIPADVEYIPMRWVPYNGGTVVDDWVRIEPGRPRVCLTLGTAGRGRLLFKESGVSLADMVRALTELDIELVVAMNKVEPFSDRPGNVRIVDYVPLSQLLPSCSAIIHHGGEGTAMAAGLHKVPQLLTPVPHWGEHNVARHIEDSGAGLVVRCPELTGAVLTRQLARLLDEPRFRKGADAFAEQMLRPPSPHEVVEILEDLVTHER